MTNQQAEATVEVDDARADAATRVGIAARDRDLELGPAARLHHQLRQHHDVTGQKITARPAQFVHAATHPRVFGAVDDRGHECIQVAVAEVLGEALRFDRDQLIAFGGKDARGAEIDAAEYRDHRRGEQDALQECEPGDR